ncbi:unnamed protein product [Schistocephalus solidus]|uniref:Uncharacterized protein n=1 Tax=Schistocephalus solidus TaxID=70667 RepID=A0A183T3E7_SCHSO|nr:unnamed protein product [Schistocephalus solidus]
MGLLSFFLPTNACYVHIDQGFVEAADELPQFPNLQELGQALERVLFMFLDERRAPFLASGVNASSPAAQSAFSCTSSEQPFGSLKPVAVSSRQPAAIADREDRSLSLSERGIPGSTVIRRPQLQSDPVPSSGPKVRFFSLRAFIFISVLLSNNFIQIARLTIPF